jgi:hypothetical protein
VNLSSAYQLYSADGNNLSEPIYHGEIYKKCNFNRDIKPSEINDADFMSCFLRYILPRQDYKFFYCEPPKILDENNECALEIDPEQWQNVLKSSPKSSFGIGDFFVKFIYMENEDSKKRRKIFGKRNYFKGHRSTFAAIGKTSEGKYELFELKTCHDKVIELVHTDDNMKQPINVATMEFLFSFTPQLTSIICYLTLLIFYLTIEELKTTYGKCWINFIINSLINYLGTIVALILSHLITCLKDHREFEVIIPIMGRSIIFIIIFTEFSLYFWLNITFFEAFYTIRYKFIVTQLDKIALKYYRKKTWYQNKLIEYVEVCHIIYDTQEHTNLD